jgi:hypothetical protein
MLLHNIRCKAEDRKGELKAIEKWKLGGKGVRESNGRG